jgi:two-component system, chemotaxis family, sensor kinase CheA
VRVRLPLTLAIMDGMSVGVGDECYILPLASVVESFQVQPGMIKTIGGSGRVVQVRDEYMPVVDLERVFEVPRFDFEHVATSWSWSRPKAAAWPCWSTSCWASSRWW